MMSVSFADAASSSASSSLLRNRVTSGCVAESAPHKQQLPSFSFEEILKSIPFERLQPSKWKATKSLTKSMVFVFLSVVALIYSPWYLLPLCWLMLGTTIVSWMTVAKDCEKNAFTNNKYIDFIIGSICLVPLCLPFESWREQQKIKSSGTKILARSRFWLTTSVWEWISANFVPRSSWMSKKFWLNAFCVYVFAGIFFPVLTYNLGLWGLFKFYLIPIAVFHFWMSTYLKVDNILPMGFATDEKEARKKLLTICQFPLWAEYLTLNLNHTFSTQSLPESIPSYNMQELYTSLQDKWDDCMDEISFTRATLGNYLDGLIQRLRDENRLLQSLEQINWPTAIFLFATPVIALYGLFTTDFFLNTWLVFVGSWVISLMGITTGYHRMFSHRSCNGSKWLKIVLTLAATSTFQGSVFDWCLDHRAHHRYTDTDRDPYNINRGFWFAHMGWLLEKRDRRRVKADISDLKRDAFLTWQHENYTPLALLLGLLLPTLICGFGWGDWRGGFFIAAVAARVFILQCTFCINSVAHTLGDFTFNDMRSPRDCFFTSLLTFGEGYHNYHHEFPYDYRNGVYWYAFDPAKWLLFCSEYLGWASNLQRMSDEVRQKGMLRMQEKRLQEQRRKLDWGPNVHSLPQMTWDQLREKERMAGCIDDDDDELSSVSDSVSDSSVSEDTSKFSNFVVCDGVVYDVTTILDDHPGGRGILQAYLGKDITSAFNGGVYNHSLCARHMLQKHAIARLLCSQAEDDAAGEIVAKDE